MTAETRQAEERGSWPAYAKRVFGILVVFVVAALAVRHFLIPDDFGRDGYFRASAPEEEAAGEPVNQGVEVCGRCHPDERSRHDRDVHFAVQCEVCHGPGAEHVKAREAGAPADQGYIFRELIQANCLACHRQLSARPSLFPTISVKDHYTFVGVRDMGTQCQECHDPHQPLYLERPAYEARIHPVIHLCSDCHRDSEVTKGQRPADHVVTFECRDCHAGVVADAAGKAHGPLECRTCHQFHRDSDFSGRIYKNGSPRFCLMCHQDRPFKTRDRMTGSDDPAQLAPAPPPLIASLEAHLDDVAVSDEDRGKRCVDCHMDEAIHRLEGQKSLNVMTEGAP